MTPNFEHELLVLNPVFKREQQIAGLDRDQVARAVALSALSSRTSTDSAPKMFNSLGSKRLHFRDNWLPRAKHVHMLYLWNPRKSPRGRNLP